jgi:hypothetical protein
LTHIDVSTCHELSSGNHGLQKYCEYFRKLPNNSIFQSFGIGNIGVVTSSSAPPGGTRFLNENRLVRPHFDAGAHAAAVCAPPGRGGHVGAPSCRAWSSGALVVAVECPCCPCHLASIRLLPLGIARSARAGAHPPTQSTAQHARESQSLWRRKLWST